MAMSLRDRILAVYRGGTPDVVPYALDLSHYFYHKNRMPWDLTPEACREEAGPDFILSGGVSPDLWLPSAPLHRFKKAVMDWIALKRHSPRLIAGAGDQVPPGADEERIHIMRDLLEEYGRYAANGVSAVGMTNTTTLERVDLERALSR
jgi:hypothetical protein